MFAGLETTRENPMRRWTAMLSFTVQAAMVAAALVMPRLSPQSLPEALVKRRIFVPMLRAAVHVQPAQVSGQSTAAGYWTPLIVNSNPVFTFRQTPTPAIESENPQAPNLFIGSGTDDSVRNSIAQILARPVPYPIAAVRPPRISVMMAGNLVDRVEPIYPTIAKLAGVQGTVVIEAIISPTGRIEQEQILSGHPLLASAALDAVRRWRYRPYVLDGEAVEVETQVMVKFVLNR